MHDVPAILPMNGNSRASATIGVRAAVPTRRDPPPGTRAAAPRPRVTLRLRFGMAMLAVAHGCGPRPKQVVTNPDPAGKVPAIEHAVARRDLTVVPQLVKDLDDDDPAV